MQVKFLWEVSVLTLVYREFYSSYMRVLIEVLNFLIPYRLLNELVKETLNTVHF
jgi:hypothetical protein